MSETCRGHLWDKIIIKLFASSWYIFLTNIMAAFGQSDWRVSLITYRHLSAVVKNEWSFISTSLIFFFHAVHKKIFALCYNVRLLTLMVTKGIEKCAVFCVTRIFIAMCTSVYVWSISWAVLIHSTRSQSVYSIRILETRGVWRGGKRFFFFLRSSHLLRLCTVGGRWMSMMVEHWWVYTDRGNWEWSKRNLSSWLHCASIIFNTLISNWCTQR